MKSLGVGLSILFRTIIKTPNSTVANPNLTNPNPNGGNVVKAILVATKEMLQIKMAVTVEVK
jgi:hypothetical protein